MRTLAIGLLAGACLGFLAGRFTAPVTPAPAAPRAPAAEPPSPSGSSAAATASVAPGASGSDAIARPLPNRPRDDWPAAEVLAWLRAQLDGPSDAGRSDLRLIERALVHARDLVVPADLVLALLAADDEVLRKAGALLASRADANRPEILRAMLRNRELDWPPEVSDSARELVRRSPEARDLLAGVAADPDGEEWSRQRAVDLLGRVDSLAPPEVEALRRAAAARSGWLRAEALSAMGRHLDEVPALREAVLAAADDPAARVHMVIEELLPKLGAEGADLALARLRVGDYYGSSSLPGLARAALAAHSVPELMDACSDPELAGAILSAISPEDPSDREALTAAARRLEGRYEDFLSASFFGEPVLFRLALADGRADWVAVAAARESLPGGVRKEDLDALLAFPGFRPRALDVMARILESASGTADFRIEVVYELGEGNGWEGAARPREILERTAQEDPSVYVRDAARRMLNPR